MLLGVLFGAPALARSAPADVLHLPDKSGFTSMGYVGGLVTPDFKRYTVVNTGTAQLTWGAVPLHPGVLITPNYGVIEPGGSERVEISLDHVTVASLPAGSYPTQVYFVNLANWLDHEPVQVNLVLNDLPGVLSISPTTGFDISGPAGGPFQPTTQTYELRNVGGLPLQWKAVSDVPWISFSATEGWLNPGAKTSVLAILKQTGPDAVQLLPPGQQSGAVAFAAMPSAVGWAVAPVSLDIQSAGGTGPVLPVGSGFSGSTPQPPQIGSGPGSSAQAIARWDVVPHRDFGGDLEVGVVAFHRKGIDRVEFSAAGGAWTSVAQMTLNPRTGVHEYWAVLRAGNFPKSGSTEIRAIAYPVVGLPRVLPSLQLNVFPGGVPTPVSMYCSPSGNDSSGNGTAAKPYKSIWKAARAITELTGDSGGGVVYCMSGDYALEELNWQPIETKGRYLTIQPAPGDGIADVRIVTCKSPGLDTDYVHLKDLTVKTIILGASTQKDRKLWIDGCNVQGGGQETSVHSVGWVYGFLHVYWTESRVSDNQHGPTVGKLMRNLTIERIGEDVFRAGAQLVVNCSVQDVDRGSMTSWHSDLFELANGSDNKIFYGLRCTDINAQGIYTKGTSVPSKSDYAFVNVLIENVGGHISQFDGDIMDHLLLWHCTIEQRLVWRSDRLSNISVRGVSFLNMDANPPSYSAPGVGEPNLSDLLAAGDWHEIHYVDPVGPMPGNHVTTGDPNFVDKSADQYEPDWNSPLKDRLAPWIPVDLAGQLRPNPASVGALE